MSSKSVESPAGKVAKLTVKRFPINDLQAHPKNSPKVTLEQLAQQLQVSWVDISTIAPNDWNPNEQTEFMFEKTQTSLKELGWKDSIKCRLLPESPDAIEIVDGEHRWTAAKAIMDRETKDERDQWFVDAYGQYVPITQYGVMSREDAKSLTVLLNNIKGEQDAIKLSDVLSELDATLGQKRVELLMPFDRQELDNLRDLKDFDWEEYQNHEEELDADSQWVDMKFRVPDDVAPIIESEVDRILDILELKADLSKEVQWGLALEKICVLSAQTPTESID